ncbi:MAG: SDR family NAD(P)-dependent oxidoreductase [Pseudomonadota bacterium]
MSIYQDKTAFVSGGAEGIGLAIAESYGKRGMNVVLADIDEQQLEIGERTLSDQGINVLSVPLDVVEPEQWQTAVDQSLSKFGKIHMLVNNAGVSGAPGPIEKTNHKDWRWVVDVNLMGVIFGAEAVVPHIKSHGEGGWLINVASMAGMSGVPFANAYTATKVAVVGMSESWRFELSKHDILVSVLCPAFVKTRIHLSQRNKQPQYRNPPKPKSDKPATTAKNPAQELVENGIDPSTVGERVVEAVEAKELYIFTHPNHREMIHKRSAAVDSAFERAAKSPLLEETLSIDPEITFD